MPPPVVTLAEAMKLHKGGDIMLTKVVAIVVDAYKREFTSKEGTEVKYTVFSVRDEDAFRDNERIVTFNGSYDVTDSPEKLIGKEVVFLGTMGYNNGELKFKPLEVSVEK